MRRGSSRTGGGSDVEAGVPLLHDPLLAQELVRDLVHLRGRRCRGREGTISSVASTARQVFQVGSLKSEREVHRLDLEEAQHARRMRLSHANEAAGLGCKYQARTPLGAS